MTLQFIALRVHSGIVAKTPVGATHRLQRGWKSPVRFGRLAFKIATNVPYAPILEYGGYTGVGPKTVKSSPRIFGSGITVGGGIFSTQAPHGMIRRTFAEEGQRLIGEIRIAHQRRWGNT